MSAPLPSEADRSAPGRRNWLRLLLAAVLAHGLVYLLLLPAWMGEDEPWHFENLTHVANGHWRKSDRVLGWEDQEWAPLTQIQALRRFDGLELEEAAETQRRILASMQAQQFWQRVDWAGRYEAVDNFDQVAPAFSTAQQPPLYYLLAGPIVALTANFSLEAQLFSVRLFSLVLLVATVALTYHAARVVFPGDQNHLALLAAFCAGWFPMHARMAAVVSNDVLARFLVTLALWLSLRVVAKRSSRREAVALVLVCLLGIATKTTAASGFGIAGLAFLLVPRDLGLRRKKWLLLPAAIVLCAGAVLFWRSMNNPAIPYSLEQLQRRFDYALSARAWTDVRDSFLGSFNWESRLQPAWIRVSFGAFAVASFGAALFAWSRCKDVVQRRLLALCLLACTLQFALILLRGVGKGRYLMPVIAALAILVVAGLVQSVPERLRSRAALVLVTLLVSYDAYFLWCGLVPNQYLMWGS